MCRIETVDWGVTMNTMSTLGLPVAALSETAVALPPGLEAAAVKSPLSLTSSITRAWEWSPASCRRPERNWNDHDRTRTISQGVQFRNAG
jgi:hypothetical protein